MRLSTSTPLLALLLAGACSSSTGELDRVEDFRQRATQYYEAGDLLRAEQQARRGLQLDPDHSMLNLILGRTLLRHRDLQSVVKAFPYLQKAYDQEEDYRTGLSLGEGHLRYAEFLIGEAANLEERAGQLGGSEEKDAEEMRTRAAHAREKADQRLKRALSLLEESRDAAPSFTFTLQLLASCYAHLNRWKDSLATLEKLEGILVESRRFKNQQLALRDLPLWQEDRLREELKRDLKMEEDSRGLAATIHMETKDWEAAEEELGAILKLDPDLDQEYYNRGYCRYQLGKLAPAAEDMLDFLRKTHLGYDTEEVAKALDIVSEYRAATGAGPIDLPAPRPSSLSSGQESGSP